MTLKNSEFGIVGGLWRRRRERKGAIRYRPEGMKLVEDIAKKKARHIGAVKLDRLFRNAADVLDQNEKCG